MTDAMEPGRWYTLAELPGFRADVVPVTLTSHSGERSITIVTSAFLWSHVFALLEDVLGDHPRATSLDDIEVVYMRNDHD